MKKIIIKNILLEYFSIIPIIGKIFEYKLANNSNEDFARALNTKQYDSAFHLLSIFEHDSSEKYEIARCQWQLGYLYEHGLGVKKNIDKAESLYKKAASKHMSFTKSSIRDQQKSEKEKISESTITTDSPVVNDQLTSEKEEFLIDVHLRQDDTWEKLVKVIHIFYKELNINPISEGELKYLKEAFLFTEGLWYWQLRQFKHVKLVILSEAPEFGSEKVYFYNEKSPQTIFLYYEDFTDDVGEFKSIQEKKNSLYKYMNEKGVIILDVFPFAFNKKFTQIGYRDINSKKLARLFELISSIYLEPKLLSINKKSDQYIKYMLRYKGHVGKYGNKINTKLRALDLLDYSDSISCIGSNNMPIDRIKLRRFINSQV